MANLEELGWIGVALGAQRAGHARGAELASCAAELHWIEEERWRIRQDLLERYYEVKSGHEEPESARGLVLKKFLVALADEDACSRLYAYGEKAYQLLNIAFLIGVREDHPAQKKQVFAWLEREEGAIASRMKCFSSQSSTETSLIGDALRRRRLFTHRIAPKTELSGVSALRIGAARLEGGDSARQGRGRHREDDVRGRSPLRSGARLGGGDPA
jgi:hypothetical protein